MNDFDNYFYKCFIEETSKEKTPDEVFEECSCKYGFKSLTDEQV